MLVDTDAGLLNVFIEPQFADICDEPLYTVQAPNVKALQGLELSPLSENRIEISKLDFLFTCFAYSWNLEHVLNSKQISEIQPLPNDVNEIPTGFCWTGEVIDLDSAPWDENDDMFQGNVQVGYCLRKELPIVRREKLQTLENFKVYPLFRYPTTSELKTVWAA